MVALHAARRWRHWLLFTLAAIVLSLGVFSANAQEKTVLNVVENGGPDIVDWFQNILIPRFEADHPEYEINFVNLRGSGLNTADVAIRAMAALEADADPQVDYITGFDPPEIPPETVEAGLWLDFNETNIENYGNLNPELDIYDWGLPYRGSQVLLVYDSALIPDDEVPHTFAELIEWIKAHPGQFVYTRPDKGGTGENFVSRAIFEVNGQDPSLFTPDNYSDELADEYLPPAWDLLRSIHPFIYEDGSYTPSNQGSVQLLLNGSVSMIPMWSDEAVVAARNGIFSDTIRLLQFTDLPMGGGYVYAVIPRNSVHLEGALEFANFMISVDTQVSLINDVGGFPAIKWELLPQDLQEQFTTAISEQVPPTFPGGDWSEAMSGGWYENVAPNIDPNSE